MKLPGFMNYKSYTFRVCNTDNNKSKQYFLLQIQNLFKKLTQNTNKTTLQLEKLNVEATHN
jgi:hypothetical protein